MELSGWITYVVATFILSLSPGPGVFSSISSGMHHGFRKGVWNGVGMQVANMIHVVVVALGLGALLVASETLFAVVKWVGVAYLTYGGSGMYRNSYTSGSEYDGHGTFEAGIDTQFPLGFSVGSKEARAGGYVIARKFVGLELVPENQEPLALSHQYEVGASFATTPVLSVWRLKLPWIAVGYHFGKTLSGVRIYTKFPF